LATTLDHGGSMRVLGLLLLICFIITSCGKSDSNAGMPLIEPKVLPVDGSNIEGLYMARFTTLNPHVNGTLPGSATLHRQEDKFYAYVRLFGGAPNAWHQQYIHEGSRCPNAGDDLNADGYIDVTESNKVVGRVLIPLDANISSQSAGKNIFPMSDEAGTYFYERVTPFQKLFNDLKDTDKNIFDNFMKLAPEDGLDIEGKVIVIHGASEDLSLPETVASTERRSQSQTLPIACGVFKPVTTIPGEPLGDEIPGPIGEVEEGDSIPETERPDPDDYRRPDRRENGDRWYDRVIDWWRSRWNRDRGNRRPVWGDGLLRFFERN
jgi:hypothetical protein